MGEQKVETGLCKFLLWNYLFLSYVPAMLLLLSDHNRNNFAVSNNAVFVLF